MKHIKTIKYRSAALLLALLLAIALPALAFADDGDAPVLLSAGDGAPSESMDGGQPSEDDGKATYNLPEGGAEDGKMYILGNPSDTQEPILTVGAQPESGQTGSDPADASAGLSEEELERRKEIYTMVALITVGAIIVGLRNKRGGR